MEGKKTNKKVYPVEILQAEGKVSEAVHAGVCAMNGWSRGKEVEKEEYQAAIRKFKEAAGRGRNA